MRDAVTVSIVHNPRFAPRIVARVRARNATPRMTAAQVVLSGLPVMVRLRLPRYARSVWDQRSHVNVIPNVVRDFAKKAFVGFRESI